MGTHTRMSQENLQTLDDVGPARAEDLFEAGYESIPSVASTPVGEISDAISVAESTAETIVESAREQAGSEDIETDVETDDVDENEETVSFSIEQFSKKELLRELGRRSTDEEVEDDESSTWTLEEVESYIQHVEDERSTRDGKTVELTDDDTLAYHILHAILEEATSQMQSSNRVMQQNAYRVADQLCEQIATDVDVYTVTGNQKTMNTLFRAISQGEMDYASRAGIPEMYGTLRSIKGDVNDVREEF